jgi:murein hydrolase activator
MFNKYGAVLLIIFFSSIFCGAAYTSAETPSEEYSKIQRDIRQQKKKLKAATKVESSVVGELRQTQDRLKEVKEQIAEKNGKIRNIKGNISILEAQISTKSVMLESQKGRLKKRLRTLQRINSEKKAILILISDQDPLRVKRISRYLGDITMRYSSSVGMYRDELARLNGKKKDLGTAENRLKTEQKDLEDLENIEKMKKKEKETLLVRVRKEKETYEQMIEQMKQDSERLTRIIKESEKREKSTRNKESKGTKTAPQQLEDSVFTRRKGHLPWPVRGKLAIGYGSQVDPLFNLPVFRSGIHIKTSSGSSVTAVAEGKVVYAAEFKGYGQLVVINHGGGYHTLYGNLAKIFSANGAIIKEKETIGEVGESATLGSSGLYFEIRYKGKPLDPQQWLRRSAAEGN